VNRDRALLYSLVLTIVMNGLAGLLTLAYANGSTIIETNPSNNYLLGELGAVTLLVRAVEIATFFPIAYLLSRAISSGYSILSAKRIYLFTFSLLIALLPAAAFADLLGDVLVVSLASDLLAGTERILALGLAIAIPFAGYQAARKWTLPSAPR
jgi:hypothetical protein